MTAYDDEMTRRKDGIIIICGIVAEMDGGHRIMGHVDHDEK